MSRIQCLLVFSILLSLSGCRGDESRILVKGVVLCDSKPIEGASVAFVGNEGGAISSAVTNSRGEFTLRAVTGKNKVAVSKVGVQSAPSSDEVESQVMPTDKEYAQMLKNSPKSIIADRFKDPEKSGIVVDVINKIGQVSINVTSQ